jgi:hypothetical protein
MQGRIVEVADDRRHLSVYRGFMLVHNTGDERQELGRVALDDMRSSRNARSWTCLSSASLDDRNINSGIKTRNTALKRGP